MKKINTPERKAEIYAMRIRAMEKARAVKAERIAERKNNPQAKEAEYQRQVAQAAVARAALAAKRAAQKTATEAAEAAEEAAHARGYERLSLLTSAGRIITKDRNLDYGEPEDSFRLIGLLWSDYLGTEIKPHDVAALMMLLKVARVKAAPDKRDHWVDIAGYAACGFDCVEPAKLNGSVPKVSQLV